MDMPFPEEGVWLVNWLGNWVLGGGHWETYPNVVYIHTPYRLDKLHSALAEAQLKNQSLKDYSNLQLFV